MGGACISRPKPHRNHGIARSQKQPEDALSKNNLTETPVVQHNDVLPFYEPKWATAGWQPKKMTEPSRQTAKYSTIQALSIENTAVLVRSFSYPLNTCRPYLPDPLTTLPSAPITALQACTLYHPQLCYRQTNPALCLTGNHPSLKTPRLHNQQIEYAAILSQVQDSSKLSLHFVQGPSGYASKLKDIRKIPLIDNPLINGLILVSNATDNKVDVSSQLWRIGQLLGTQHNLGSRDRILCYLNPVIGRPFSQLHHLNYDRFNTYLQLKSTLQSPCFNVLQLFNPSHILTGPKCQLLAVYVLVYCLKYCMALHPHNTQIPINLLSQLLHLGTQQSGLLLQVINIMKLLYSLCVGLGGRSSLHSQQQTVESLVYDCVRSVLQLSMINSHIVVDAYLLEFGIEIDEKQTQFRAKPLLQQKKPIINRFVGFHRHNLKLVAELAQLRAEYLPALVKGPASQQTQLLHKWRQAAMFVIKSRLSFFTGQTTAELVKLTRTAQEPQNSDFFMATQYLFAIRILQFIVNAYEQGQQIFSMAWEQRAAEANTKQLRIQWEGIVDEFMSGTGYCSAEMAITILSIDGLMRRYEGNQVEDSEEELFSRAFEIWARAYRDPRTKFRSWFNNQWVLFLVNVLIKTKSRLLPNFVTSQGYYSLVNICESFYLDHSVTLDTSSLQWVLQNLPGCGISGIFYNKTELFTPAEEERSLLTKTGSNFLDNQADNLSQKSNYSQLISNTNSSAARTAKKPKKKSITEVSYGQSRYAKSGVYQWGKSMNSVPLLHYPSKNLDVLKVSCSNYHVIIACTMGIFGWGENASGQLGQSENKQTVKGIKMVMPKTIKSQEEVMLSCGNEHSAILIKNEPLYMFGQAEGGIISGNGFKFESISCGGLHTLGIKDGYVYSWGRGEGGQLGHKTEYLKTKVKVETTDFFLDYPKLIVNLPKIRKSVCGDAHSVLLSEMGDVYVFGFSYQGQLGLGLTGDSEVFQIFEPVKLAFPFRTPGSVVVDIFAGPTSTFFKTSQGQIYSCGLNDCNQLGKQKIMKVFQKKKYIGKDSQPKVQRMGDVQFSRPNRLQIFNSHILVSSISCGQNHCIASVEYNKKNKMFMGWGLNKQFQISCQFPPENLTPRTIDNIYNYNFSQVCCGSNFTIGLTTDTHRLHSRDFESRILQFFEKSVQFQYNF